MPIDAGLPPWNMINKVCRLWLWWYTVHCIAFGGGHRCIVMFQCLRSKRIACICELLEFAWTLSDPPHQLEECCRILLYVYLGWGFPNSRCKMGVEYRRGYNECTKATCVERAPGTGMEEELVDESIQNACLAPWPPAIVSDGGIPGT